MSMIKLKKRVRGLEALYSKPWARFFLRGKRSKWFRAKKLNTRRIERTEVE